MNDILSWINDISNRKDRKAREVRFYRALDEYAPQWEKISRLPEFAVWMNERSRHDRKRYIELIEPAYDDYDAYAVSCFYNYYFQQASRGRHGIADYQKSYYKKGDIIGNRYEVLDLLGYGGFGIVYLVYSHELATIYALKTFHENYHGDDQTKKQFRKEAQIWIGLERHPYLVRSYLVDEISSRLFIAMEYVGANESGLNTLDSFLKQTNLSQVLRWAIQFCHGMEYAYAKGIRAHRDIKPTNIMISPRLSVKITDFGLAGTIDTRAVTAGQHRDTLSTTFANSAIGTPEYMAPEHFAGIALCDERSDLYSFGIVLYQMASGGRLPFICENSEHRWAIMKHCHLEKAVPVLETPLFQIIQRCLKKDPANRIQTFSDLRALLELMLENDTGETIDKPGGQDWEWWELGNKGNSLCRIGKHDEAIICFDEVLKMFPFNKNAMLSKGLCLSHLDRFEDAIGCYSDAIKSDPKYHSAWHNKGYCCVRLNRLDEAMHCYNEALQINQDDLMTLSLKASLLSQLDRHDEAVNCYKRILGKDHNHVDAWFGKGFCHHVINEIADAIQCYDKVLALNSKHLNAWVNKGKCFMALRQMAAALVCYDRALEIDSTNPTVWNDKAICEDSLSRRQDAIHSYGQYILLVKDKPNIDRTFAEKRLIELKKDVY